MEVGCGVNGCRGAPACQTGRAIGYRVEIKVVYWGANRDGQPIRWISPRLKSRWTALELGSLVLSFCRLQKSPQSAGANCGRDVIVNPFDVWPKSRAAIFDGTSEGKRKTGKECLYRGHPPAYHAATVTASLGRM
jgi:hypothetical protein